MCVTHATCQVIICTSWYGTAVSASYITFYIKPFGDCSRDSDKILRVVEKSSQPSHYLLCPFVVVFCEIKLKITIYRQISCSSQCSGRKQDGGTACTHSGCQETDKNNISFFVQAEKQKQKKIPTIIQFVWSGRSGNLIDFCRALCHNFVSICLDATEKVNKNWYSKPSSLPIKDLKKSGGPLAFSRYSFHYSAIYKNVPLWDLRFWLFRGQIDASQEV